MFTNTHLRSAWKYTRKRSKITPVFLISLTNCRIRRLASSPVSTVLTQPLNFKQEIERTEVRWACRPENWSFTTATDPASRLIFRQPMVHLTALMRWSTVVLKPHVQGIDWCIFQQSIGNVFDENYRSHCLPLTRAGKIRRPMRQSRIIPAYVILSPLIMSNRMTIFIWRYGSCECWWSQSS
jgi:hypothetical protein